MTALTTYELDGRIATIAMDDGKVNAFSLDMLRELHGALDRAERDAAVVVLTGREGRFSAGFDLATFAAAGEPGGSERLIEMLRLGAGLAQRILAFPTPVVVACNGHAIAAGAFPLLAADARIGAGGAFRIGLNEVKIGLTLPWFAVELARQRLHPAHFDRAVVTARLHGPPDAVAAGFLDEVVAPDELAAAARARAAELAELNMDAHVATKLRARGAAIEALRDAIARELTPEALAGAAHPPETAHPRGDQP